MLDLRVEAQEIDWSQFLKSFQNEAAREGMREAGAQWHIKHLDGHFERGADREYGYARRTPSTYKKKNRRGLPPLVWSGDLRRMSTSGAQIRAAGRRVRVKFGAPGYIETRRREGSRYPDIKAELTATTDGEAEEMSRVMRERAAASLREQGVRAKRKKYR